MSECSQFPGYIIYVVQKCASLHSSENGVVMNSTTFDESCDEKCRP
jgi:hypothetical protein